MVLRSWRRFSRVKCAEAATGRPNLPSSALHVEAAVSSALTNQMHLATGEPLVVSVSGGADSVALFRALLALTSVWNWRLHLLHFNHGLRAESAQEEAFVQALASRYDVPFHIRRLSPEWASQNKSSIQARARAWRQSESVKLLVQLRDSHDHPSQRPHTNSPHQSMLEVNDDDMNENSFRSSDGSRSGRPNGSIALAHHADDQVETLLLKLLRGCHISNLRGMEWQRGPFVRPMLGLRKAELISYLHDLGQDWMEDASNSDCKYQRNRVRHQLVPLMDCLSNGALRARVQALEKQSTQLRDWLDSACSEYLTQDPAWHRLPRGLTISRFTQLPEMVQDEALHRLVQKGDVARLTLTTNAIGKFRSRLKNHDLSKEWSFHIGCSRSLYCVGDVVRVSHAGVDPHAETIEAAEESMTVGESILVFPRGWDVGAGWVEESPPPSGSMIVYNVPKNATLRLRYWKPGDAFTPGWRKSDVAVTAFLRGQRVPLEDRRFAKLLFWENQVIAIYPDFVAKGFQESRKRRSFPNEPLHSESERHTTAVESYFWIIIRNCIV
ncbi:MAG: hypothetical protein SGPRY_010680 [Prymnesium sp.]